MVNEYLNTIKKSPLFNDLSDEDIICILKCLSPKILKFNKNEFIVNSGDSIKKFAIVLEGESTILKENADGNRVIMSIVRQGELFGETLVFSSCKIWPVSVKVQNYCKVLFLTNSDLIERCSNMCPWHDKMIKNFIKIISDRTLMLNKKIGYLTIKSIRKKFTSYLLDQYQSSGNRKITLSLNRNDLAEFLNVSRPSLSREICELRNKGIIDFHLSTFKITDLEALKKYCD